MKKTIKTGELPTLLQLVTTHTPDSIRAAIQATAAEKMAAKTSHEKNKIARQQHYLHLTQNLLLWLETPHEHINSSSDRYTQLAHWLLEEKPLENCNLLALHT